jgi:hypothetical protein
MRKSQQFQIQSPRRFQSTMGKAIFLVATGAFQLFPSFQCFSSTLLHQGRLSRKRIIEKGPDLIEKSLRRM